MPSCPAIAIRVPQRFRDPTYHRADSENGDHIDDPSGGDISDIAYAIVSWRKGP